jgi:yecA family protein
VELFILAPIYYRSSSLLERIPVSYQNSRPETALESYRSIRTGGARSLGASRSSRFSKSDEIVAPQIAPLGHRPFTKRELDSLARWLQDSAWPVGSMNIYMLEGYLTALLVMPLGLRTGIWMPAIWNENGWNIPFALQDREKYHEFVELLIGYMRSIDAGFTASPPKFETVLQSTTKWSSRAASLSVEDWVQGFGKALHLCSHLNLTDVSVNSALHAIATQASESNRANKTNGKASASIRQAVCVLAQARTARGPLSELPVVTKIK